MRKRESGAGQARNRSEVARGLEPKSPLVICVNKRARTMAKRLKSGQDYNDLDLH